MQSIPSTTSPHSRSELHVSTSLKSAPDIIVPNTHPTKPPVPSNYVQNKQTKIIRRKLIDEIHSKFSDQKIVAITNNNNNVPRKPRKPPIPHHIPSISPEIRIIFDELLTETKTINSNINKPMKIPLLPDTLSQKYENKKMQNKHKKSNNKISNIKQIKKAIIKSKRARPNPTKRRQ
eukprot:453999_1